jgi:hypothetical protein
MPIRHVPQPLGIMTIHNVCSKHFGDKYLKAFVRSTGTRLLCDVCYETRNCLIIRDIAERIKQDLTREYDALSESDLPYDSEEGTYLFGTPRDTNELVESEALIAPYEVVEAICQEIDTADWVDKNWMLPRSDYMRYGWQVFQRVVKHRMRFVFFSKQNHRLISERESDSMHPQDVLQAVGGLIKILKITTSYEPRTLRLYRARQHRPGEAVKTAAALGAPPEERAQANRMSPAGISMFYGAFDSATCLAEVTDYDWKASSVTYGVFTNQVALRLIDFSLPFDSPSIFNPDYNDKAKYLREGIVFLKNFICDLQRAVTKKDLHIEYVPTQVVCEYLRYMYEGGQIDGLVYNSVKHPGSRCVVLFVDNTESVDEGRPAKDLYSRDTLKLVLLANSIVRISGRRLRTQRQAQRAQEEAELDKLMSGFSFPPRKSGK